jgi:ABC-type multidrug transport system fused ATPase/permease subunit
MSSLDTARQYCQTEPEALSEVAGSDPAIEAWPTVGTIKFCEVCLPASVGEMVFSCFPPFFSFLFVACIDVYCEGLWGALHKVSFEIHGGECCGILSDKGSRGRSSVIAALFRMAEVTSGKIIIDGHDISRLGLGRLRQAISLVPQQPVLFSGSIRKNLDPLSQHSDEQVMKSDLAVAI